MKTPKFSICGFFVGAVIVSTLVPAQAMTTTVYSEAFAGSTLGSASPAAPTGTTTSYQALSSKNATSSSISGSSLSLAMGATSSGFAEMQALFTPSAVTLTGGHSITLEMSFVTTNIMLDGTSMTLNAGLYNSGGLGPVPGNALNNGGLTTSDGTYSTGNAEDWTGYIVRTEDTSGTIYTRGAQTDATNQSQDLLFSNAGGGAFDSPAGDVVASTGDAGVNFSNGNTYTLRLDISFDGTNITVTEDIYSGTGTAGTNLYTRSGTEAGASTTAFDGLAFGFRGTNDASNQSAPATLQVTGLTVTHTIPEPSGFALLGLGSLVLLRRRRA